MPDRAPVRLHLTTTFKLSLLYLGLFVASVSVVLWAAYRSTAGFLEQEIGETITLEVEALKDQYLRAGLPGLVEVVRARSSIPHNNSIYLLLAPNGQILAGNLSGWPDGTWHEDGTVHFKVAEYGGTEDHPATAQAVGFTLPGQFRLLVGRDMSEIDQLRDRMAASLGWILTITAGLGLIGGGLTSRSALRRIEAINRTTRRIMAGDLSGRVAGVGNGDEIDRLAGNLNAMLDQIERLMNGVRQVTDSIAHDLRTPLSRLRTRIELVLLKETDDPEVYRAALQESLVEADRLLDTFKALLSIAEAESGTRRNDFKPVELADTAHLVADLYEPLAEESGLAFTAEVRGRPLVQGNDQLLSQAIANLLDNAIKYTPAGGRVSLVVDGKTASQGAAITVTDSGPGIPPDMREKVLGRFVRLDQSRNTPGNGLGLSLVAAVARLHDARLVLDDANPGLKISLILPPQAAVKRIESVAA